MIYIFTWPHECCKQFANFKRWIGCHKPPFPKKPICTFVLAHGSWSLAQFCVCSNALNYKDSCKDGDPNVVLGFEKFIMIQMFFAIISGLFGFYAFVRVWAKIMSLMESPEHQPDELSPAEDRKYKMIRIKLHTIRAGFKAVCLYDIGVLIYFLASVAIAVLSFMAPNAITHASECPHAEPVRSFGIGFVLIDAIYVPLWWFCCPNRKGVVAEIPWPKEGSVPEVSAVSS